MAMLVVRLLKVSNIPSNLWLYLLVLSLSKTIHYISHNKYHDTTSSKSIKEPTLPSYLDFVHYSNKAKQLLLLLKVFMNAYIYPVEKVLQ